MELDEASAVCEQNKSPLSNALTLEVNVTLLLTTQNIWCWYS